MTNDEHRLRRKTLTVIVVGVIVSAVLLGLLYTVGTHRCLEETLGFGQETMVFLENACEKYDRYEQGRKAEETHDLLAAVESFATFLSSDRVEVNNDLIEQFVHAENLSGLMVMDSDGHMAAHYDIDGRDPLMLWREELACAPVASMYQGSKVTYSTVVERRGVVFCRLCYPVWRRRCLGIPLICFRSSGRLFICHSRRAFEQHLPPGPHGACYGGCGDCLIQQRRC